MKAPSELIETRVNELAATTHEPTENGRDHAHAFESRPVDAAGGEDADLPEILLSVSSDVFRASGTTADGIPWGIYAEVETQESARSRVSVDAYTVAQITVHSDDSLTEEVQEVCAALVWSAIRAVRIKRLASSTGSTLASEETENRVVPSGGEIGAPSGARASIFGTPPELIPEGAEEFVSDGFRALRFACGRDLFEVRVVRSDGYQVHNTNRVWLGHILGIEKMLAGDFDEPTFPWLRYWLPRADEPIERASEPEDEPLGTARVRAVSANLGAALDELGRPNLEDPDGSEWEAIPATIPYIAMAANEWESERASHAAELERERAKVRELEERIQSLNDSFSSGRDTRITSLQSEVTRLTAELASSERANDGIREELSDMQRMHSEEHERREELQSEVTRLTGAYTALRSSVEGLHKSHTADAFWRAREVLEQHLSLPVALPESGEGQ